MKARIAVAVSGGGRSLANLLSCQNQHQFEIVAVIASSSECGGVSVAREAALPLFIGEFSTASNNLQKDLSRWLELHQIDLVALAGFLKKFPCLVGWDQKVINIHPALLPKFGGRGMYGDRVHTAVLAAGEMFSGASIHYVNTHYDEGDVIAQTRIPVNPKWTHSELAANVFAAECKLYPAVLDDLIGGDLPIKGGVKIYEF